MKNLEIHAHVVSKLTQIQQPIYYSNYESWIFINFLTNRNVFDENELQTRIVYCCLKIREKSGFVISELNGERDNNIFVYSGLL